MHQSEELQRLHPRSFWSDCFNVTVSLNIYSDGAGATQGDLRLIQINYFKNIALNLGQCFFIEEGPESMVSGYYLFYKTFRKNNKSSA